MPNVLILGASSDMAVAIARRFAKSGYNITLAGRNVDYLEILGKDLQVRFSVITEVSLFDARDFKSHRDFYEQLKLKPDIAICVFGYMGDQQVVRTDWGESLKTLETNYTGAVSILNKVAEDFEKRNAGTIVGISSVAGERGRQSNYIYGSAKAGFTAYLEGLRNRLYHSKAHVLTVLPGFVYTKMTEDLNLPPMLTAKPEEVAEAVFNAVKKGKNIIYVKWFWRYIMHIIKAIPEPLFKRKKL